jgi:hypothetical protein
LAFADFTTTQVDFRGNGLYESASIHIPLSERKLREIPNKSGRSGQLREDNPLQKHLEHTETADEPGWD